MIHAESTWPKQGAELAEVLQSELDSAQWPRFGAIERSENQLSFTLYVPQGLKWFDGHFPDNPVLPGVVQVHWAVSLARMLVVPDRVFNQVENLKFKAVVLPGMDLVLTISRAASGEKIHFSFVSAETGEVHSEGRLSFS